VAVVYANHAGTSWPKAPGVVEAVQRAMLDDPSHNAQRYRDGVDAVVEFFGLPSRDRLLFAPSCTSALAVAIGDLVWQAGDCVITSQLEHHALARPVQKLVNERGVEHCVVPYRDGAPLDLAFVERRLEQGNVRLVAVTAASNVTGERLPIDELVPLAHRHGALVLLDAAQHAGLLPLDVGAFGVDLMTFAAHKGLLAPFGVGGLWAAERIRFACPAAVCELGGVDGPIAPFPGFCDMGSVDFPALAGLTAALRYLEGLSADERERPLRMAARLRDECRARGGVSVLGGDGPRTATSSLVIDALPLERAQRHFQQHGVIVRAGTHCAPMALDALGRADGVLRVSFGVTSGEGDVDAVLRAIDAR